VAILLQQSREFYVICLAVRQHGATWLRGSVRPAKEGQMRTSLGLVGATLLLAGPALAADLSKPPVYKAPPLVPVLSWDGWYIGGNAGYLFNQNNNDVITTSTNTFAFPGSGGPQLATAITDLSNFSAPAGKNGFIAGGQIGYNKQLAPMWVAGIEADIQGVSANGSSTAASSQGVLGFPVTLTQTATVSKDVDYLGTVRGRLGFLVTPSLLFYGTGGLAYGGVKASTAIAQAVTGPNALLPPAWTAAGALSDTRIGWSAGGGVEWLFVPGWSAKVEYLHYDLGSATYGVGSLVSNAVVASPFTTNTVQSNTKFTGDFVRAGVNFHF
jgi:outer membrane immunogenic protein